jgi:ABC-2 type transport system permease protein
MLLCRPLIDDRASKVIIRIAATPTKYKTYLGAYLLAFTLILMIQSIIFLLVNLIYWRGNIVDYGYIFLLYFFYSLMSITFALFWNSLFKQFTISFGLFSGVGSLMCLISGISIPMQIFPNNLKRFAMILPTHWLPYGLDALTHDKIGNVWVAILILTLFSGILFMLGSKRRF